MPIHFACERCYQLLSISAHKLGQQVVCPRCRHSNTVPDAAGAAKTLAARKAAKAAAKVAPKVEEPPAAPAEPSFPQINTGNSTPQFGVFDDTELVFEDDLRETGPEEFDARKVAVSRYIIYVQGLLLAGVALVAFTLGVLVGGGPKPRGLSQIEDKPCTLKGSLSFRERREGPEATDRGAVLVVVPENQFPPGGPLNSAGLRPDDSAPPADHPTWRSIRELGGAYVRADAKGQYTVTVPHPGKYRVLVISALARRGTSEELKKSDLADLGKYFRDPLEFLGENKYLWTPLILRGDTTATYSLP